MRVAFDYVRLYQIIHAIFNMIQLSRLVSRGKVTSYNHDHCRHGDGIVKLKVTYLDSGGETRGWNCRGNDTKRSALILSALL